MNERKFKTVNRKIGNVTTSVRKDGIEGTGIVLPYHCGFCKDKDGTINAAFRTQSERTEHTTRCTK